MGEYSPKHFLLGLFRNGRGRRPRCSGDNDARHKVAPRISMALYNSCGLGICPNIQMGGWVGYHSRRSDLRRGHLVLVLCIGACAGRRPFIQGALAEIAVERPVQLADGTYSFPTLIKSVGDSPMINYQFVLSNSFWPSLLSKEQEDERFYRNAVSTFEKDVKNNPQPQEVGKVLRPGAVYRAFVPTANLTQEHYNDIASGRVCVYFYYIKLY